MDIVELAFWVALACVVYTYAGYPLLVTLWARLGGRPTRRAGRVSHTVSIIVAAYNEEETLADRLDELTALIKSAELDGEIIVVSDGSTDLTAQVAEQHGGGLVRVYTLSKRVGKAAALSFGAQRATGEILVFADTRQKWKADALERLLENFADESVGAVSGDLVVHGVTDFTKGLGLYWSYEKLLRRMESQVHSTVGVTGAISAVRHELFAEIPCNILLDDVYWPLQVIMQGKRVIHDKDAIAFDQLPERPWDEFRRKVRTLSGNFQLLRRLPKALVPGINPVWFQFVSHKVFRLAVPWALLVMLATSAFLPGAFYQLAFWGQIAFYGLCLLGLVRVRGKRLPMLASLSSFVVLNAAAWLAFWVYLSGHANRSWGKVAYQRRPAVEATPYDNPSLDVSSLPVSSELKPAALPSSIALPGGNGLPDTNGVAQRTH
jgi:cellulose synthase/poly-beta-1,6-N-acetylglucosamine synthase-like glycosyltransferase